MKVLLINTNDYVNMHGPVAPIGIDYLQGALERERHEVKLVDLSFAEDSELISLVGDFTPDAVGMTIRNTCDCYFFAQHSFLPRIEYLIQMLKNAGLENIIVGGPGFTSMARLVFEALSADYGVVGDGEIPLVGLLKEIEKGVKQPSTPSVLYRNQGEVVMNPRVFFDLADIPDHPRTLVDNVRYYNISGTANIQTKRGCTMQCAHCLDPLVGGKCYKHRTMSPNRVADEFQRLHDQGIMHTQVNDPEFNLPPNHALAVCKELVRRKNKVGWSCCIHPNAALVSEELVKAMKEAGCKEVSMGIESLSYKVMKTLNIYHTPRDVEQVIRLFRKHDLPVSQWFIVGLPNEGVEELNESLDFIEQRLNPLGGVSAVFIPGVRIYAGTILERFSKEHGVIDPDHDCLEPTFYKPKHLEFALLPELYKRVEQHHLNWTVFKREMMFEEKVGAEFSKFIAENKLYGPSGYLLSEFFKSNAGHRLTRGG